jgi:hypothetical protein
VVLKELMHNYNEPPNQFGFRRNNSTHHAEFVVRTLLGRGKRHKRTLYALLLDASKAFDRLDREIMFARLAGKIPSSVWLSLYEYYKSSRVCVQNGVERTELFPTTSGVKQGGPLSPKLYSVFCEPLIREIIEQNVAMTVDGICYGLIVYADDIMLICESVANLQRAADICARFGNESAVKFNPTKSHVMVFGDSRARSREVTITMNGQTIPKVQDSKHLGYCLVENLKTTAHAEERIRKFISTVYSIDRLGAKTNELSPQIKIHLVKAFCRPVLNYGLENTIVNKNIMRQLKKHEGLVIKRVLGIGKRSRHTKVMAAVGLEPTEMMVEKIKTKFIRRTLQNEYTRQLVRNELMDMRNAQPHVYP